MPAAPGGGVVAGQTPQLMARPQDHGLVARSLEVAASVRAPVHRVVLHLGEHGELVPLAWRRVLDGAGAGRSQFTVVGTEDWVTVYRETNNRLQQCEANNRLQRLHEAKNRCNQYVHSEVCFPDVAMAVS